MKYTSTIPGKYTIIQLWTGHKCAYIIQSNNYSKRQQITIITSILHKSALAPPIPRPGDSSPGACPSRFPFDAEAFGPALLTDHHCGCPYCDGGDARRISPRILPCAGVVFLEE